MEAQCGSCVGDIVTIDVLSGVFLLIGLIKPFAGLIFIFPGFMDHVCFTGVQLVISSILNFPLIRFHKIFLE